MLPTIESPELLMELEAARIVAYWRGYRGGPLDVTYQHSGLRCRVVLDVVGLPVVRIDHIPTDCEQDVIDLLTRTGRRMLLPEIVAKLDGQHGESTIQKALPRLVKAGRITNVKRRGYGIATVAENDCQ